MKSAKFLPLLTLVLAFGATAAEAHDITYTYTYPVQKNIEARQITIETPLYRAQMMTEILTVIHFNSASSAPSAKEEMKLRDVAAVLKSPAYHHCHVAVQGYTDSKGKTAANQRLSYHRAVHVMHELVKKYGVPAAMLSAQGFGEENPVADNSTAEGRAANRRVVFVNVR